MNRNVADRVTITIVDDNSIDFLLASGNNFTRYDLPMQFAFNRKPVQGEFGISFWIEIERADRITRVLFDAGLTGTVLLHNMEALGLNPSMLDHIAISHGHPDHYGGLEEMLSLASRPLPVSTHIQAFEPRYAVMPSGAVAPFYNAPFNRQKLEEKGAAFILATTPVEIAPGVHTTGEIERKTSFEGPRDPKSFAGLYQVLDGVCACDQVMDEIGLVINVRDAGLIVLTGCGHAGVINTINQAIEITGVDRILAVMGGFHLGFPGTPEENVQLTIDALAQLQVGQVVPMHCTGLSATSAMAQGLESFTQSSVGTTLAYGADASVRRDGHVSAQTSRDVPA